MTILIFLRNLQTAKGETDKLANVCRRKKRYEQVLHWNESDQRRNIIFVAVYCNAINQRAVHDIFISLLLLYIVNESFCRQMLFFLLYCLQ